MATVHRRQHLEAVHHRHQQIQQHQRNFIAARVQNVHALLPVRSFQNLVVVLQHFRQQRAVQLRVIHNQDAFFPRAQLILLLRRLRQHHLRHNHVRARFRLIHQLVGLLHGRFQQAAVAHHAADANRNLQIRVPRHRRIVHRLAHLQQAAVQAVSGDAGHNQQELVSAQAHQQIAARGMQLNGLRHRLQHNIARAMPENIIIKFEVIHINHGNARLIDGFAHVFLVIAAVERPRERIVVQLVLITGQAIGKLLARLGVNHHVVVKFLHQFQHIAPALDMQVTRCHLIDIRIIIFELDFLAFLHVRPENDAVSASLRCHPPIPAGAGA